MEIRHLLHDLPQEHQLTSHFADVDSHVVDLFCVQVVPISSPFVGWLAALFLGAVYCVAESAYLFVLVAVLHAQRPRGVLRITLFEHQVRTRGDAVLLGTLLMQWVEDASAVTMAVIQAILSGLPLRGAPLISGMPLLDAEHNWQRALHANK